MTGLWCQWCWLQQVIIAAIIFAFPWNDNSRACLKKYQSPEEQFFLSQLSHFMADQLRERNTCSLKIGNSLTSLTFLTLLVDVWSWCKKYFLVCIPLHLVRFPDLLGKFSVGKPDCRSLSQSQGPHSVLHLSQWRGELGGWQVYLHPCNVLFSKEDSPC